MIPTRNLLLVCILIASAFQFLCQVEAMCPKMMMRAQSNARQFNRFRNPELDFPSPGTSPDNPAPSPTNETHAR